MELEPYTCGISIAVRLEDAIIDRAQDAPTPEYARHYRAVNAALDGIAARLVEWIVEGGFRAAAIPAGRIVDAQNLLASLSHKAVARMAGIGPLFSSLFLPFCLLRETPKQRLARPKAASRSACRRTPCSAPARRAGIGACRPAAPAHQGRPRRSRGLAGDQDRHPPVVRKHDQLLSTLNIGHQHAIAPGADHSGWQIMQSLPFDGFALWKTAFAQGRQTQ